MGPLPPGAGIRRCALKKLPILAQSQLDRFGADLGQQQKNISRNRTTICLWCGLIR
jgi:hypothetical protein